MGFAKVYSGQTQFLAGQIIDIEIDLAKGLHAFSIVGLPDKAVEESKDRVSAAIKNSGFKSPKYKNQKVVISLAPADVKKEGPAFDLAIAIGYLLAAEEIRFDPQHTLFLGELSLDGFLRPISGTLPIVVAAAQHGFTKIFLPQKNAAEAALIFHTQNSDVHIFPAEHLRDVIAHVNERRGERVVPTKKLSPCVRDTPRPHIARDEPTMLDDIYDQPAAKRALEIAAAGEHNILFIGPPGTGKTMLAHALRGILPPLSQQEMLEVIHIYSASGGVTDFVQHAQRPFRAPHHTSSYSALVGGGPTPRPGEMTLAHRGVLFLDEFPEFDRRVIESLRQPLEEHVVRISRTKGAVVFPAHFMLVAAMNPCPCGWYGSTQKECRCTTKDRARYSQKISGPVLDRIDMCINIGSIDFKKISGKKATDTSVRERVARARDTQHHTRGTLNAHLTGKHLRTLAPATPAAEKILETSATSLGFSMRAYHRTWRVARTIADLAGALHIEEHHMLEALQFRGNEY